MEWVFLRFRLPSFMPWSDVRRIPQVRVGGLSIHISESLSSSKGRKNNAAATRIGSIGIGASGRGGSNSTDGGGQTSMSSPSTSSHFDRKDSWAHQGRRASRSRSSFVGSYGSVGGGGDGDGDGGDGYEWEQVAQATLEHALGHEFTAKYQVGELFVLAGGF